MNQKTIEINADQRRALRAAAHHLKPVASIGQHGLTEAVLKEIDLALKAHELIKVKIHGIERDDREALLVEISSQLACEPVQHIGNILVLWREKPAAAATPVKAAPRRRAPQPKTKKQAAAALENKRRKSKKP